MAIRPMLQLGNPLLRQPAQPVDDIQSAEIQTLIADLWDTVRDFRRRHGWGYALAAPVVGVPLRVAVIEWIDQQLVLINPRFERWSREQSVAYETCVTFGSIWGAVCRQNSVVVVAHDERGLEQRYEAEGTFARRLQHEMDHLDGLVWLDRDPDLVTICTTDEYRRQQQPPSPELG